MGYRQRSGAMDKILSSALSRLHKDVLKPRGYRKTSATFIRERTSYTELINVQASPWNGPWGRSFHVNCGVRFRDLPIETPGSHVPNTHWSARMDVIVPDSPAQWKYSDAADMAQLMQALGADVVRASEQLAADAQRIRHDYLARAGKQGTVEPPRA